MGQRIAYARLKAGMKQYKVAEYLQISGPSVSDWETGKTEPSKQHLVALARLLDCSILWLLDGDNNPFARAEAAYLKVPDFNRDMALEHAIRTLERWIDDDAIKGLPQSRSKIGSKFDI